MAWEPKQNTLDVTQITENLFAYLEGNQADALEWAKPDGSLKPIEKFYRSTGGRAFPIYPKLMLVDKGNATEDNGDTLEGRFGLTFDVVIKGGDTEQLVQDATYYAAALESMLTNIPTATLIENARGVRTAFNDSLETRYDQMGQHETDKSIYFQRFRTEVVYRLIASAYI